ncbi:hypothetical protein HOLleu_36814 [Holothuria leucospilota]|uniref:Uncharacterized protein n=1 Tax=Holothuria leucospilota TaxID=206669 RepID=A0A9Q0YPS7_HOLLE|nr:hypothetical protein HOLleu_36814 [Holothuria leucospilota]
MAYGDDTQLYQGVPNEWRGCVNPRLELCLRDMKSCTTLYRLVLNDSKTEVIYFSSKFIKTPPFPKITVGNSEVETLRVAKNFGVIFFLH